MASPCCLHFDAESISSDLLAPRLSLSSGTQAYCVVADLEHWITCLGHRAGSRLLLHGNLPSISLRTKLLSALSGITFICGLGTHASCTMIAQYQSPLQPETLINAGQQSSTAASKSCHCRRFLSRAVQQQPLMCSPSTPSPSPKSQDASWYRIKVAIRKIADIW